MSARLGTPPRPTRAGVGVLKFGSSILSGPDGFREAAREVRDTLRRRDSVIAIVSAARGQTDLLLSTITGVADDPPPPLVSHLLSTGEEASVYTLGAALAGLGICAELLSGPALQLHTRGPLLDGHPVHLNVAALRRRLSRTRVVVAPGFVGRGPCGSPSLLGRGGSDLTALYVADAIGATECRLIKDVDGLYEADPNASSRPQERLVSATWDQALEYSDGLVQPKALRFAQRRALEFVIAAPAGAGTRIGRRRT